MSNTSVRIIFVAAPKCAPGWLFEKHLYKYNVRKPHFISDALTIARVIYALCHKSPFHAYVTGLLTGIEHRELADAAFQKSA
jgi:hypothetical protein